MIKINSLSERPKVEERSYYSKEELSFNMEQMKKIGSDSDSIKETSFEIEITPSDQNGGINKSKLSIYSKAFLNKLNYLSKNLDSIGVEMRGIERIQPYERTTNITKQFLSVTGLWISATGGLSSMSTFFLGPLAFDLGFKTSLIAGIIGSTLGCAVAAYLSMMGPRSGCRQMVGARFIFGWWFVKLVALVSIIGVLGWSIVNCVVGGQILRAVSESKIPLPVGIIIVAVISLVVAIFGIKQLLKVETILAFPVLTAFLLLYITSSEKYSYLSNADFEISDSRTKLGNWLTFFSLAYSVTATWGSIASDYLILFPEKTPDYQIFLLTFLGIAIPTNFVGILGLLIGNAALTYPPWTDAYAENGMGGLLNEAFRPWGNGGKFLTILLFLSLISNNIINTYSAAFGVQLAGVFFAKIPRWIWAIVVTGVYLACALIGRNKFSTILGNFLPMLGYWISMYFIILLEENTIFRSKRFIHLYTKEFENIDEIESKQSVQNIQITKLSKKQYYNWNIWNDHTKLTYGIAGTLSFLIGAIGAVVGMAQVYWTGPLAAKIGDYGGDIAMWLCMGFSGIVFPFFRYMELKKFGR